MPQRIEKHWLNRGQMAKSLDISVQAFDQWRVVPVARIGRQVFFTAGDVTANRLEHQKRQFEAKYLDVEDPQDIDYEAERARLTKEQADAQELKNAQARREVAPIQLIEWTLNRVGTQIGALLESIPQKVKRRVPSLNAPQIDIIKREVIKAQNLMARITVDLDEYRPPENSPPS